VKKILKVNLVLIIFMFFFIDKSNVYAKSLKDLKSELASLKEKYNKNQSSKKMTESEIAKVEGEIDSINNQIDDLNHEIDELNADIERRNEEIKKMNDEIKTIVHYYQVASSDSIYLEYVFKAEDYTDFIYRLAVSEQLSAYRKKIIDEYNALIEENKKKVGEIAEKQVSLKGLEDELSGKFATLQDELAGISMVGVSLEDEISDLEKTINEYQNKYKCSETEDVTSCVYRYNHPQAANTKRSAAVSGSSADLNIPSSSGFYLPISTWTNIYPFHHHDNGTDFSTPEGQGVHPIADGEVIDIWPGYSCGGNMVWVSHNVNGKKYTSAYFHLKSIHVNIGDKVTHNDTVGTSGGIRKGESYNSYDSCTTGPHLHLQVSTGWYDRYIRWSDGSYHISYSEWNRNSFDSAKILNF